MPGMHGRGIGTRRGPGRPPHYGGPPHRRPMGGPMGGPPPPPHHHRPYRRGGCLGCLGTFIIGAGGLIALIILLVGMIF